MSRDGYWDGPPAAAQEPRGAPPTSRLLLHLALGGPRGNCRAKVRTDVAALMRGAFREVGNCAQRGPSMGFGEMPTHTSRSPHGTRHDSLTAASSRAESRLLARASAGLVPESRLLGCVPCGLACESRSLAHGHCPNFSPPRQSAGTALAVRSSGDNDDPGEPPSLAPRGAAGEGVQSLRRRGSRREASAPVLVRPARRWRQAGGGVAGQQADGYPRARAGWQAKRDHGASCRSARLCQCRKPVAR